MRSHCPLSSRSKRIFNQLRPKSYIHHSHGVTNISDDQNRPQLYAKRQDRRRYVPRLTSRTVEIANRENYKAHDKLWSLVQYLQEQIQLLPETPYLTIPTGSPTSPIFSLCSPNPRSLALTCQKAGLVVRAIMPPTVPKGGQRARVCLHTDNTEQDIDRLVTVIAQWIKDESTLESNRPALVAERSRI